MKKIGNWQKEGPFSELIEIFQDFLRKIKDSLSRRQRRSNKGIFSFEKKAKTSGPRKKRLKTKNICKNRHRPEAKKWNTGMTL